MQKIVTETNKYAIQSGSAFRTSLEAIERYVGLLLRMGIVHMPRYRMYWSTELRYSAIADYMSRKEFEDHGRYIHFNDNVRLVTSRKDPEYDQLYKIRPLLDSLRKQCLLVAPEQRQSVDEQIIPFKGKNRLRQYLPKKPKRWGFKVIARCCSQTGFTHDFTLYQGSAPDLVEEESIGYQPPDFVIQLCKSLPQHKNYIVYFDNWFNFPELQIRLKSLGFYSGHTLRKQAARLRVEVRVRFAQGRPWSMTARSTQTADSALLWYDNRAVQVSATHAAIHPIRILKRWDNKDKKFVEVQCPAAITEYNSHMGGVDLFDMLSAIYRIDHKSVKWYRRIFYWALNVACINSWILYKRHCSQLAVAEKDYLDLLGFVTQVSQCLIVANKPTAPLARKRGRPSSYASQEEETGDSDEARDKRKFTSAPLPEIRLDNVGHLPLHTTEKGRCIGTARSVSFV